MVKCVPEFEYFTVFLKIETLFKKIKRSKDTDYAALTKVLQYLINNRKQFDHKLPIVTSLIFR